MYAASTSFNGPATCGHCISRCATVPRSVATSAQRTGERTSRSSSRRTRQAGCRILAYASYPTGTKPPTVFHDRSRPSTNHCASDVSSTALMSGIGASSEPPSTRSGTVQLGLVFFDTANPVCPLPRARRTV